MSQKKKRMSKLKKSQLKLSGLRNQKQNGWEIKKEQSLEFQRLVGHHQTYQHILMWAPEGNERDKGKKEEVFEEILTENFPNLINSDLHLLEA